MSDEMNAMTSSEDNTNKKSKVGTNIILVFNIR
jgi:hypothetical protein